MARRWLVGGTHDDRSDAEGALRPANLATGQASVTALPMQAGRPVVRRRQLRLVDVLLRASVNGSDPALRDWIHDRVEATFRDEAGCRARFKLICDRCRTVETRETRCGPDCPHCRKQASRRARVAGRIARSFPDVRSRHLVLSLPGDVQGALARGQLEERTLQRVFERVVFGHIEARLRELHQIPQAVRLGCGAVSVIHGFTGDLRYAPHLHALVLEGAFVRRRGRPCFMAAEGALEGEALTDIAAAIHRQLLNACTLQARVAPAVQKLREELRGPKPSRARDPASGPARGDHEGQSQGLRVFAGRPIHSDDRVGRRRILEYLGRPPISPAKVRVDDQGRLLLPDANAGEHALAPDEVAKRVAAVAASPTSGTLRQHGLMVNRSARHWGLMAEQLPLIDPPARTKTPTKQPSPDAPKPEAATAPKQPTCRRCGGGLRALAAEEVA